MSESEAKIAELTARIAVLEAAAHTGKVAPAVKNTEDQFPFLSKLDGDDLIATQALIQENATLRQQNAQYEQQIAQSDYRISHLKRNLERLIPAQ